MAYPNAFALTTERLSVPSAGALQVYFGGFHLGLLEGETATFTANHGCPIRQPVELTFEDPKQEIVSG